MGKKRNFLFYSVYFHVGYGKPKQQQPLLMIYDKFLMLPSLYYIYLIFHVSMRF